MGLGIPIENTFAIDERNDSLHGSGSEFDYCVVDHDGLLPSCYLSSQVYRLLVKAAKLLVRLTRLLLLRKEYRSLLRW
jgi:hypothetical protein